MAASSCAKALNHLPNILHDRLSILHDRLNILQSKVSNFVLRTGNV